MLNADTKAKDEKRALIQDIIVTVPFYGEYKSDSPIRQSPSALAKMSRDQEERLDEFIVKLMKTASVAHEKNQHNDDCITRLTTNEFFLYTEKPLSIKEFQSLQERIAYVASKLPENVHLALASFAVKTDDNKHLMNVVSYVQCGKDPQINLIVKNHSSMADPAYSIMDDQKKRSLYNAMIEDPQHEDYEFDKHNMIREDQLPKKLEIFGKQVDCSFNNVFRCKTKGGAEFISCVDICLDHHRGVAKKNLEKLIDSKEMKNETIPTMCSHLVTSSTISKKEENRVGQITHVDPKHSPESDCKEGCSKEGIAAGTEAANDAASKLMESTADKPRFGQGEIKVRITPPMPVQDLAPHFLDKVNDHNREVKPVNHKQKQLKGLEAFEMPAQKIPETVDKSGLLEGLKSIVMPGKRGYVYAENELNKVSHSPVSTTVPTTVAPTTVVPTTVVPTTVVPTTVVPTTVVPTTVVPTTAVPTTVALTTVSSLSTPQASTMSFQYGNHKRQSGSLKESITEHGASKLSSSEDPLNSQKRSTPGK